MMEIFIMAMLIAAFLVSFLTFVVSNCSKSPSERDKDYDNFL